MKFFEWLRPGIKVKRYIVPGLVGLIIISYGLSNITKDIYKYYLNILLAVFLILAGCVFVYFSVKYTVKSIISVLPKGNFRIFFDNEKLSALMYEKRILVKGPKIVTIGGGTGLSNLLRGLKAFSSNITAIVTVADDGGGSGVLREEMGMLPPGDIRNCILALADTEPLMERLLQYRFTEGSLKGQSFGNLFLAALNGISGNFEQAVQQMGKVLAVTGKVLPVSGNDIRISAELTDGRIIEGESNIGHHERENGCSIKRIFMQNVDVTPLPEVLQSIFEADVIIFAPGSLYTSIIPNIIVPKVSNAIKKSHAIKIYSCNIMTQPNETEEYAISDHIKAIEDHSFKGVIDYCLANDTAIPDYLREKYENQNSYAVKNDRDKVEKMGVELILGDFVSFKDDLLRHDSQKITSTIIELVADNVLVKDRKRVIDYYYVKDRLRKN